jgi:hypothetical protein
MDEGVPPHDALMYQTAVLGRYSAQSVMPSPV